MLVSWNRVALEIRRDGGKGYMGPGFFRVMVHKPAKP
jgi:hypothetical protein